MIESQKSEGAAVLERLVALAAGLAIDGIVGSKTLAALRQTASTVAGSTAPAAPPSTVNAPDESNSSDLLRQAEIKVAQDVFGGELPEPLVAPVRSGLRVTVATGTPFGVAYRNISFIKAIYDHMQNPPQGRNSIFQMVTGAMLAVPEVICDCLNLLFVAFYERLLEPYPHAYKSVEQYLTGVGDLVYSAKEMVDQDSGFRDAVRSAVSGGKKGARLNIDQQTWGSDDWLFTFGGIDFASVTLIDGTNPKHARVHITIADPYQWHPDEWRAAPCLHTAMENKKMSGAKGFMQRVDETIEMDLTTSVKTTRTQKGRYSTRRFDRGSEQVRGRLSTGQPAALRTGSPGHWGGSGSQGCQRHRVCARSRHRAGLTGACAVIGRGEASARTRDAPCAPAVGCGARLARANASTFAGGTAGPRWLAACACRTHGAGADNREEPHSAEHPRALV